MVTQKFALKKIRQFAREIKASGLNLRKVILFGSYVHGKPHQWSDIDVALVADEFTGVGFYDVARFARINNKKPYIEIETRTFNTNDFDPEIDPLVDEILRTGIEVEA